DNVVLIAKKNSHEKRIWKAGSPAAFATGRGNAPLQKTVELAIDFTSSGIQLEVVAVLGELEQAQTVLAAAKPLLNPPHSARRFFDRETHVRGRVNVLVAKCVRRGGCGRQQQRSSNGANKTRLPELVWTAQHVHA